MEFSTPELAENYRKVIDVKVISYDEKIGEVTHLNDEDYDSDIFLELFEYCKKFNDLDTKETYLYKTAIKEDIPSKFIYTKMEGSVNSVFDDINPLDYTSMKSLVKDFSATKVSLSIDDFLEGFRWNEDYPAEDILLHYDKYFPNLDTSDFNKKSWKSRIKSWKKEDNDIINEIYLRQMDLLMYTPYESIQKAFDENSFNVRTRIVNFDVEENFLSMTSNSIHDKFIFCKNSPNIPFVKLVSIDGKEIYKIYNNESRDNITYWIEKDEKMENETPFPSEDYIFFLLNFEGLNSPTECYLSLDKLFVKIPSSYNIDELENYIREEVLDMFIINIDNRQEKSIEIDFNLKNFPAIEPVFLQFYLTINAESSLYIQETNKTIFSNTRKIRVYYKPVSENSDKYFIEYEGSPNQITVKGPNEKSCLNFMINIVARSFRGFFLRQNAIKDLFSNIIYGGFTPEGGTEKDRKKKKKSLVGPHQYTKKDKLGAFKELIKLPYNYSRLGCACPRQPIVLTDEEVEAWLDTSSTIYDKTPRERRRSVKTFVTPEGKKINFACPGVKYAEINLTKKSKDSDETVLSPCCWDKDLGEEDDITKINPNIPVEELSKVQKNDPNSVENILDDKSKNIFISQEVKHILMFMKGSSTASRINLTKPSTKVSKNSFLEAVLVGLSDRQYPSYEYRNVIADAMNPLVFAQESLGIEKSPETVMEEFRNAKMPLNSKIHYRALEEYFKIHIFVFRMNDSDDKFSSLEYNFELETPANKIFPIRVLHRDRPCVILMKSGNEYNTVTFNDVGKWDSDMSIKLMELFNYTNEIVVEYSNSTIVRNLYSRINWENFFKNDPIVAQEIDIAGKTRVIQLTSGTTISIPPTQPFNVPLVEEYNPTPIDQVIDMFGMPTRWDSRGVWYSVMGIENLFYIITGEHNLGMLSEDYNTPLNIFDVSYGKFGELNTYRETRRAAFALIQILQWAWRIDGRPLFEPWLRNKVSRISSSVDFEDINPVDIHISLPTVDKSTEGLKRISEWWPTMFTSSGKIRMWTSLYEKIIEFFDREEDIMGATIQDEIISKLIGFYEVSEDYPVEDSSRVFVDRNSFQTWAKIDRRREENPEIKIYSTYSEKSINEIMSKNVPVRLFYKNYYIIVENIKNNTMESAIQHSYHWKKEGFRLEAGSKYINPSRSKYQIIILSFSKKHHLVESDATDDAEDKIYILKYPNETYASILMR